MTEWTEAELAILREMAEQGASVNRAAARLKRTAVAVKRRAKDIGLTFKKAGEVRVDGGLNKHWSQNRSD